MDLNLLPDWCSIRLVIGQYHVKFDDGLWTLNFKLIIEVLMLIGADEVVDGLCISLEAVQRVPEN